jgi:hypothetical protein
MGRKKSSKRRRPELLVRFIDITAVSAGSSLRLHVDFVAAALGASPRAVVGAGLGTLLGIPVRTSRRGAQSARWRRARRVERPSAMGTRGGRGCRGVDRVSDWNGGEGRNWRS